MRGKEIRGSNQRESIEEAGTNLHESIAVEQAPVNMTLREKDDSGKSAETQRESSQGSLLNPMRMKKTTHLLNRKAKVQTT